jgi:hypothetical protein
MQKKTNILIVIMVALLTSGCINTSMVPVADQNFGKKQQINGVLEETITVKEGEDIGDIVKRISDATNSNIILSKNIPEMTPLPFDVKKVSLVDYLRLYAEVEGLKGEFTMKSKGVKNTYFVDYKKKKVKVEKEKRSKTPKERKMAILETKVELPEGITMSETINILRDSLKVDIVIYMTDRTEFLKKQRLFVYKGTIRSLLKEWEYENRFYIEFNNDTIEIKDSIIKQYQLNVPSLKLSNEKTTISEEIDIYKQLDDKIKVFLPEGQKYIVDRSTQSVVAEGDRSTLSKIKMAIDQFNETYHSVIQLKLNFYTVDVTEKAGYGLDLSALAKQIATHNGSKIGLSIGTGTGLGLTEGEENFNFKFTKSETQNLAIDIMNNYGETRKLQSPILTTVNNVPTSINITTEKDYVKEIKEEVHRQDNVINNDNDTSNDNDTADNRGDYTTKEINVEKVKYGFELSALPIMSKDNDEITVILNPKFSDLVSMTSYKYTSGMMGEDGTVPENEIQLVEMATTDLGEGQIVKVKNGMTAVIGGYYIKEDKDNKNTVPGITTKNNILDWVASKKSKDYRVKELVIFITATKTN